MSAIRPGTKQTEVGVIPEEWGVEPLGALIGALDAGVSVRSVPGDAKDTPHSGMVLKTSCISSGRFFPDEAKPVLPEDISRVKTPVRADTILVSRMNTPNLVGEVGYVEADDPNLFLPDRLWMAGTASGRKTNMRWLTATLAFGHPGRALRETATGTSGSMKNISKPALRGLLMPAPKPSEQQAIAEALADADALIKALEALIAKKSNIKQGAMQELLTGQRRLPGFGDKAQAFKATELGQIPSDWDLSTVGTQFYVDLGKMLDEDKNLGVLKPYLGNRAIRWGSIDESAIAQMRISKFEMYRFRLKHGDLLVCEGGEVGRAAIWNSEISECYYQKALHRLRSKASYLPTIMLAYLKFWDLTGQFLNYVTQTSIAHLPKEKFATMPLPMPTLDEQRAIASVLLDMDSEIAALEGKLAKAQAVKQGMMQVLLTGEIRLV